MGIKAGNIYALGVQLGICSFFASRGDTNNAKTGLGFAAQNVNTLAQQGIQLNIQELNQAKANPTQSKLEALRGDFRNNISTSNSEYLAVYDFAVGVGIAEGESSVPDSDAHVVAKNSMTNAADLEGTLLKHGVHLVPVTDKHDYIETFRKAWQDTFSQTAVL